MTKNNLSTNKDLSSLEDSLGVRFKDREILHQALIHRSYLNEQSKFKFSNERLEFLGDSVLSLITSTYLYHQFPQNPEGKLTSTRSILVQAKTLARLADKLNLGDFLLMSRGEEQSGGRKNVSLLADSFEAVLGAIYLDSGLDVAKSFLEKNLLDSIDQFLNLSEVTDYKSQLQEKIQEARRVSPTYTVIDTTGPDHAKIFNIEVLVATESLGRGVGKSKQEAEQDAARAALENLALK